MGTVYRLNPDGTSTPMRKVHCLDEARQLQQILEKNLALLPGDQINPGDPRRWLLVKREMPVPDPGSGQSRWAIDFVLLDQSAIPTFVECKRFADTRSRREVVAQMLEYAANGHYYWSGDTLRVFAERTAQGEGLSLEEALQRLGPDEELSAEEFFERAEENLRQGRVRLVFFLEEASFELKSIVDFLNRQMERTEVLLVEARQYELEGITVVVPTLFGYTEEARRVKRSAPTGAARRRWDEGMFFEAVAEDLGGEEFEAIRAVYDTVRSGGLEVTWGTGRYRGSFNVKAPDICPRSFFTVWSDGGLTLNFAWLNGSEEAERFRDAFGGMVESEMGWGLPSEYVTRWVNLPRSEWIPKARGFAEAVVALVDRFRRGGA